MVMKRLNRNAALDALDLFRRLDVATSSEVSHPDRIDNFVGSVRKTLEENLTNPSILQGWRAQTLFASLVTAFDRCDFMALIDTGEVFAETEVKPADFFLCLKSGERIVVDVKSVNFDYEKGLDHPIKFSKSEIERLTRYSEFYQADLYIAFYVSPMCSWYLLNAKHLDTGPGGGYRTSLRALTYRNEFASLGDRLIGTLSPIEVVTTADPTAPNSLENRRVSLLPPDIYVGGTRIVSTRSRALTLFIFQYGDWEAEEQYSASGDELVEVRWIANPPDPNSANEVGVVGTLSAMYSRMFEGHTRTEFNTVAALDLAVEPGVLSKLLPDDFDYEAEDLHLVTLSQRPSKPE